MLNGVLFEDKTPLIKDVYDKPRATTGKIKRYKLPVNNEDSHKG